jgi:hypothetical protein
VPSDFAWYVVIFFSTLSIREAHGLFFLFSIFPWFIILATGALSGWRFNLHLHSEFVSSAYKLTHCRIGCLQRSPASYMVEMGKVEKVSLFPFEYWLHPLKCIYSNAHEIFLQNIVMCEGVCH